MAYEKKTWVTGEVIKAEHLNHIEEGIESNGVLFVDETVTTESRNKIFTLSKTWQEIHDALYGGKMVIIKQVEIFEDMPVNGSYYFIPVMYTNGELDWFDVGCYNPFLDVPNRIYTAESANGYPSFSHGGEE